VTSVTQFPSVGECYDGRFHEHGTAPGQGRRGQRGGRDRGGGAGADLRGESERLQPQEGPL